MAREKRVLSKDFVEYQEIIVGHQNYRTLPNKTNAKGQITWVKQGDKERANWWDDQKSKLELKDRASVARLIHPKELQGLKPCQVCGTKLSIFAVYPNSAALKKLNSNFNPLVFEHFKLDIKMIAAEVSSKFGKSGLRKLAKVFQIESEFEDPAFLADLIVKNGKNLSPGVMSNAPDRLDGFHTYNACCRSTQDTGRHASNLARYSTDRRAYENWAEGDWRGADRLMGVYKKETKIVPCPVCGEVRKMSADHIGPISLGFMHRMDFQPMCVDCNSSKNNRWSYADVVKLMKTERDGIPVVSWHSEEMWEAMKPLIIDDATAIRASALLRQNMHHVLVMLSILHEAGFGDFLKSYLHPEYALFDYEFEEFNPATGSFNVRKYPVDSKNTQKQAERYIRISFETLETYAEVSNRNAKKWHNKNCDEMLDEVKTLISAGDYEGAKAKIREILALLADQAADMF